MTIKPPFRLILAPLLGVTTSAFRSVYAKHFSGLSGALAPFILAGNAPSDFAKLSKDLLPSKNRAALPVTPQIIGHSGKEFAELANYLRDILGYDEVNWNIGCAAGTTPSRLRGAALLEHPQLVDRFLDKAFSIFRGKISIKMRLGMQSRNDCFALLPILNRYPVSEICLHPRVGVQRFSGAVNLEAFAEFCREIVHPILYNGDIATVADADKLHQRFPFLAGLMMGRGVVTNPWLPQAIQEKNEALLINPDQLRRFHDELLQVYQETMEGGAQPVLGRMRELWPYWECHWPGYERHLRKVMKAKSLAEYIAAVDGVFHNLF